MKRVIATVAAAAAPLLLVANTAAALDTVDYGTQSCNRQYTIGWKMDTQGTGKVFRNGSSTVIDQNTTTLLTIWNAYSSSTGTMNWKATASYRLDKDWTYGVCHIA